MQWNDNIDEAPKDGTEFLAWDGACMECCHFRKDGVLVTSWEGSRFSMDEDVACDATHWMPLPEPPK